MGRLRHFHKDTIVDLQETEELEDLAGLGCNLVDTADTNDEVHLWLGGDVEVTRDTG